MTTEKEKDLFDFMDRMRANGYPDAVLMHKPSTHTADNNWPDVAIILPNGPCAMIDLRKIICCLPDDFFIKKQGIAPLPELKEYD